MTPWGSRPLALRALGLAALTIMNLIKTFDFEGDPRHIYNKTTSAIGSVQEKPCRLELELFVVQVGKKRSTRLTFSPQVGKYSRRQLGLGNTFSPRDGIKVSGRPRDIEGRPHAADFGLSCKSLMPERRYNEPIDSK